MDEALRKMDKDKIEKYVTKQGCRWEFNPPHASHFGGVWERQISTIRLRVPSLAAHSYLTHELLITLMTEVVAIVYARPISAIPTEVDNPQPLSGTGDAVDNKISARRTPRRQIGRASCRERV